MVNPSSMINVGVGGSDTNVENLNDQLDRTRECKYFGCRLQQLSVGLFFDQRCKQNYTLSKRHIVLHCQIIK